MPAIRPETFWLKVPVPKSPDSVVVAEAEESVELVPQAKPRTVEFEPPVAVISPFNIAEATPTPVAVLVVTVGALAAPVDHVTVQSFRNGVPLTSVRVACRHILL